MSKRYRAYVFTHNNYTEEDCTGYLSLDCTKYICFGKEEGEEKKTPHLQGYIVFKNPKTLRAAIRVLGKGPHLAPALGTAKDNIEYCSKDGDFYEKGERPAQGKRNDIIALKTAISNGVPLIDLYEDNTNAMFKYRQSAMHYKLLCDRKHGPRFDDIEVIVVCGETGTGKTRWAYDTYPDLYDYQYAEGNWWDGYNGEETILVDDFYGGIKYGYLLRLLDGYRFNIPIKGGFTWKKWQRVIVTSNNPPSTWYKMGLTPALKRRFSKVMEIRSTEEGLIHYDGWKEWNERETDKL